MANRTGEGTGAVTLPLSVEIKIYGATFFGQGVARMMGVIVPLWLVTLDPSAFLLGIAIGARHMPSLFLSIPSGAAMDKLGVRVVLLVVAAVAVVVAPLYPVLPYVGVVIVLQMLLGSATTISWLGAQTLIGQLTKGSAVHAGRLQIVNQLGNLVCPPLIGLIWDVWGAWAAFGTMGLFKAVFFLICLGLPDTGAKARGDALAPEDGRWIPRLSDYTKAFRLLAGPVTLFVIATSFIDNSGAGINQSFYVVYLEQLGISGTAIGLLFTASSLFSILGSLSTGTVASRVNQYWLVLVLIILSIACMSATPLLKTYWLLMVFSAARGYVSGLAHPFMQAILSRSVAPDAQGLAVGLRLTGNRVAGTFVPVIMGAAVETAGLTNGFLIVGGSFIALMGIVAIYIYRNPAFRT